MAADFSYLKLLASLEQSHALPSSSGGDFFSQPEFETSVQDYGIYLERADVEEKHGGGVFIGQAGAETIEQENPNCFETDEVEEHYGSGTYTRDVEVEHVYCPGESEDEIFEDDESNSRNSGDDTDDVREESYMFPIAETYSDDYDDDDEDFETEDKTPIGLEASAQFRHVQSEEIETEKKADENIAGFKKRKRNRKGESFPSCRESRSMGAVEKAMRSSSSRKTEQIFLPVVGTVFDSLAEAYEFYNLYSWEKGFGINYGKNVTNKANYKTMQELHCANEGFDKRCIHQSQRCGCKAAIRLLRTEDHGWYISKFVEEHNHQLSESCGEKMQWRSHRQIDESAKNMIKYLRDNNVPLGKVHSIMGSIHGSVRDLPFTKRSLRTLCQQLAREQMDNDVKKTLEIFRKMRLEDPDFAYSVDVDKHNRIKTLIWTNHRSKMQYHCFGDVFTFDTTYCTNIYKMPFGLFVGVNNHFQSTIFAGVLMRREKTKNFIWVFNEFLALMGGKHPITILTDQCQAMRSALKVSMPNTIHLWCKWHVLRKAQESLGPVYSKNGPFRQEFHKLLNEMLTIEEFEQAWEELITKYKLKKNPFIVRIYECRTMWAKPYSMDKFCARMMSTQRGESANHMLKTYVRGNSTMNNFVEKYNDMMHDRAMEEDREEHKTKMMKKSARKMWPLQNHASKIYTRNSFKLFTSELEKSYHFVVVRGDGNMLYNVNHSYSELREAWVRVSFKVTANKDAGIYECECGLFKHFGILCCHAIRVMNYLGVVKIPARYILKRWTKDARDVLPENMRFLQKDSRSLKSHTFRDSLLYATAMKAVKMGNKDLETFNEMMKHLGTGIKAVSDLVAARGDTKDDGADHHYESSDTEWNRGKSPGYQSEPDMGSKGKQLYSHPREGAVLSSFDMTKLKGPLILKSKSGRKRTKRFLSPVEINKKGKKKSDGGRCQGSSSFKQTKFCGVCRISGHNRDRCPLNEEAAKTQRKTPCCSTCKLPGHKASQCYNMNPSVDDFDFRDL